MKRLIAAMLCLTMLASFAPSALAFAEDAELVRSKVGKNQILSGVRIHFSMSSYPTDALADTLELMNDTDHAFSFGLAKTVEKKIDGKWYVLPEDPNVAYPMIGLVLAAKTTQEYLGNLKTAFGLYAPTPGEYRVLWRMQEEETDAWGYACGEFRLHPPGVLTLYAMEPVNVRAGAGTKYRILGELPAGGTVEYLGESGKWTKCLYDPFEPGGSVAYVYSAYLSTEKTGEGKTPVRRLAGKCPGGRGHAL